MKYADGQEYEGEFRNDSKNGKGTITTIIGTFTYSNGDEYKGEWKNDKKEGRGN